MNQLTTYGLVISPSRILRPDHPSKTSLDEPTVIEGKASKDHEGREVVRKAIVIANCPKLYDTGSEVIEFVELMMKILLDSPVPMRKNEKIVISLEREDHLRIVKPIAQELLPEKLTWVILAGMNPGTERTIKEAGHAKADFLRPRPEYHAVLLGKIVESFTTHRELPRTSWETMVSMR